MMANIHQRESSTGDKSDLNHPSRIKQTTTTTTVDNNNNKSTSGEGTNNNLADNDDPLNSLTTHQITQLAKILRLPPAAPIPTGTGNGTNHYSGNGNGNGITTSHKGWLTYQREEIKTNLDPILKESREDRNRRLMRLPISADKSATLCSAHRGLRPDLIVSAFGQLRRTWEGDLVHWEGLLFWICSREYCVYDDKSGDDISGTLGGVRRRRRRKGKGQEGWLHMLRSEVEGFIQAIIGVSALTMPESDLRQRFDEKYLGGNPYGAQVTSSEKMTPPWSCYGEERNGDDNPLFAGPDDRVFKYISTGCQACILATVGRGGSTGLDSKDGNKPDILRVLRAALMAGSHIIRPNIVRGGLETGEEITTTPGLVRLVDAWIQLAEDEEQQQVRIQTRRQRKSKQPQHTTQQDTCSPDKAARRVDDNRQSISSEPPLTPYLQRSEAIPRFELQPQAQTQQKKEQKVKEQPSPSLLPHTTVTFPRTTKRHEQSQSQSHRKRQKQNPKRNKQPVVYVYIISLSVVSTSQERERKLPRRRRGRENLRADFKRS